MTAASGLYGVGFDVIADPGINCRPSCFGIYSTIPVVPGLKNIVGLRVKIFPAFIIAFIKKRVSPSITSMIFSISLASLKVTPDARSVVALLHD